MKFIVLVSESNKDVYTHLIKARSKVKAEKKVIKKFYNDKDISKLTIKVFNETEYISIAEIQLISNEWKKSKESIDYHPSFISA